MSGHQLLGDIDKGDVPHGAMHGASAVSGALTVTGTVTGEAGVSAAAAPAGAVAWILFNIDKACHTVMDVSFAPDSPFKLMLGL